MSSAVSCPPSVSDMVALSHPRPSLLLPKSGGVRVAARSPREGRRVKAASSVTSQSQMERGMFAPPSGKISLSSQKACPEKAVEFIRALYPAKTAENVASDTGISAETVKKWLDGTVRPSWDGLSCLIFAYGFPFLVAVFPRRPLWLSDAYQRAQLAELEAEQARIQSKISALRANQ